MISTHDLEALCLTENITLKFYNTDTPMLGYYFSDGDFNLILINELIKSDTKKYRSVLAEELGHHFTTIGDQSPRQYMHYRDRLELDRYEKLAMKWATNYLLPTTLVLGGIRSNKACSLEDMADTYDVTDNFLLEKFKFMAFENMHWKLDEFTYLNLGQLPSLYLINMFK